MRPGLKADPPADPFAQLRRLFRLLLQSAKGKDKPWPRKRDNAVPRCDYQFSAIKDAREYRSFADLRILRTSEEDETTVGRQIT